MHEYHYKGKNGTEANKVYCDMRVEWIGPQIAWSCLPPGMIDITIQSLFSPQRMHTTAHADVLAGVGTPCKARQVRGEKADAYVPWAHHLWRAIWPFVKKIAKDTVSYSTSVTWQGEQTLGIKTSVELANPLFRYELSISNSKANPVAGQIRGLAYGDEKLLFELPPGSTKGWIFGSHELPGEAKAIIEFQIPRWRDFGFTHFPLPVLVPDGALLEAKE